MHDDDPLKLRSYLTDLQTGENFRIRMMTLKSLLTARATNKDD